MEQRVKGPAFSVKWLGSLIWCKFLAREIPYAASMAKKKKGCMMKVIVNVNGLFHLYLDNLLL